MGEFAIIIIIIRRRFLTCRNTTDRPKSLQGLKSCLRKLNVPTKNEVVDLRRKSR